MTVRYDQEAIAALSYAKLPVSKNNVQSLVIWACSENNKHDISTKAKWNLWDTEEQEPGATDFNRAGVKDYQSMQEGIEGWWATLRNGYYPDIILDLEESQPPNITCASIAKSRWGSNPSPALVVNVISQWNNYAGLTVGGSEDTTVTIDNTPSDDPVTPTEEGIIPPKPPEPIVPPVVVQEQTEEEKVLAAIKTELDRVNASHQLATKTTADNLRTHAAELVILANELDKSGTPNA